jgi:hypothetical protein
VPVRYQDRADPGTSAAAKPSAAASRKPGPVTPQWVSRQRRKFSRQYVPMTVTYALARASPARPPIAAPAAKNATAVSTPAGPRSTGPVTRR